MSNLPQFNKQAYKTKLEEYLSAWKPVLDVQLSPYPMQWWRKDGDQETKGEQYTIDVIISDSLLSPQSVKTTVHHDATEFDINEKNVWRDAYNVQEAYFDRLELKRGEPDKDTPYWHLWSYLDQPTT